MDSPHQCTERERLDKIIDNDAKRDTALIGITSQLTENNAQLTMLTREVAAVAEMGRRSEDGWRQMVDAMRDLASSQEKRINQNDHDIDMAFSELRSTDTKLAAVSDRVTTLELAAARQGGAAASDRLWRQRIGKIFTPRVLVAVAFAAYVIDRNGWVEKVWDAFREFKGH